MTEEKSENPKEAVRPSALVSRRQFIQLGITAVGAAWAGVLVQSKLYPAGATAQEAVPVTFPLSELPVGGTKKIVYGGVETLVLRTAESIKAFSLICTHLGCLVEWQPGDQQFYCPCHDGRFDQFGEVLGGPPPIPLEEFPVRVEEDTVVVGEVI